MTEILPFFLGDTPVSRVSFSSERVERLKTTGGRRAANDDSELREKIGEQIRLRLEEVHSKMRKELGFKRRDVSADFEEPLTGRLITNDFTYSLRAEISPDRAGDVHWICELNFSDGDRLSSDSPVLSLLAEELDTLVVSLSRDIDIAQWIDLIEDRIDDQRTSGISLDYDLDCRWCELSIKGVPVQIRLERREIRMNRQPGTSLAPSKMLALLLTSVLDKNRYEVETKFSGSRTHK
jgi:hypothetical protein